MTEFGKTDYIPFKNFEKAGYNIVIYPVTTLRIAMKAIDTFVDSLKAEGTVEKCLPNMQTRKELYELLNYTPGKEFIYPSSKKSDPKF